MWHSRGKSNLWFWKIKLSEKIWSYKNLDMMVRNMEGQKEDMELLENGLIILKIFKFKVGNIFSVTDMFLYISMGTIIAGFLYLI